MSTADPKRETERFQILGELRGEVMVFQPIAVREISQGGALIESAFPLQLDSLHQFRLTLGARSIVLNGRVAHSRISDVDRDVIVYRSGIEFVEPSERVHDAIVEFIGELKVGRQITGASSP